MNVVASNRRIGAWLHLKWGSRATSLALGLLSEPHQGSYLLGRCAVIEHIEAITRDSSDGNVYFSWVNVITGFGLAELPSLGALMAH